MVRNSFRSPFFAILVTIFLSDIQYQRLVSDAFKVNSQPGGASRAGPSGRPTRSGEICGRAIAEFGVAENRAIGAVSDLRARMSGEVDPAGYWREEAGDSSFWEAAGRMARRGWIFRSYGG